MDTTTNNMEQIETQIFQNRIGKTQLQNYSNIQIENREHMTEQDLIDEINYKLDMVLKYMNDPENIKTKLLCK